MKKLLLLLVAPFATAIAQTPAPPAEIQIKLAVMAAPADKRDGAAVLGYNDKNELVQLRKGTNEMICITDDPAQ